MTSWHSYGKIYALGHREVKPLFDDPVVVEEKVDGSQFSFGYITNQEGELQLRCRSKGAELNLECPEKMFERAVETVKALQPQLHPDWTYRGEYLNRPKHNALAYDRAPDKHIIIFDIAVGEEEYLAYPDKVAEAKRLGLECVPMLDCGMVGLERIRELLNTTSILGSQKIEGVVIKNYLKTAADKKTLMGKFVSEAYKEVHNSTWKETNPGQNDILIRLRTKYATPARWAKAVQHLREAGQLEDSPKDIGKLMKEVQQDVLTEEKDAIIADVWKWVEPHLRRGVTGGLPEWYKEQLLKLQFEKEPSNDSPRTDPTATSA